MTRAGREDHTGILFHALLKNHMHYRGVKAVRRGDQGRRDVPRAIGEGRLPLEMWHITALLETATYRKKALYLALPSSGIRVGGFDLNWDNVHQIYRNGETLSFE